MAGADVLGCIAAIVSAFHGAADLIRSIKDRNDRRRRMHGVTQNAEEAVAEKMLLKSLSDSEAQCKHARDERYRRYGLAFKTGDQETLSALKDVMVGLQMDIISALQIARAVETAKLDLSRLLEAAITNKNAALRAMDDLCKRLPVVDSEAEITAVDAQSVRTSNSTGEVRMTGVDRPLAVSLPTPPSSPGKHSLPTSVPLRRPSLKQSAPAPVAAPKKRGFAKMFSGLTSSLTMANDDYGAFKREANNLRTDMLEETGGHRKSPDPEQMAGLSLRDSGFSDSDTSSRHHATASITSTMLSEDRYSSATADSFRPADGIARNDSDTLPAISLSPDPEKPGKSNFIHSPSNSITMSIERPNIPPFALKGDEDEIMRATCAPEVVTPGYESMLPRRPWSRSDTATPQPETHTFRNIHPAFRDAWMADPRFSPPEQQDSGWAPLYPPPVDVYHNLCKGASQMRERLEEGLSVTLLPSSGGTGTSTTAFWKCKQCEFRSPATLNSHSNKAPPDHIYILPSGIRYRWHFLAKSHVRAAQPQSRLDAYLYGCIFCAAEGRRDTAAGAVQHVPLDALMSHILTKHKPSLMTPAVRAQTRCIIAGGTAEDSIPDDEWEIDLPESYHRRRLGGVFTRR